MLPKEATDLGAESDAGNSADPMVIVPDPDAPISPVLTCSVDIVPMAFISSIDRGTETKIIVYIHFRNCPSDEQVQLRRSCLFDTNQNKICFPSHIRFCSHNLHMSGTVTFGKVRLADPSRDQAAVSAVVLDRVAAVEKDIATLQEIDAKVLSATTAVSNRVTAVEASVLDAIARIQAIEEDRMKSDGPFLTGKNNS